jgi:hypothetical protein
MPAIVSNQVRGLRQITQIALVGDNTQQNVDLPRGPAIESALIQVTGSIQVTTGFTSVLPQAPIQMIKRVDWVINGSLVLDSVAPQLVQANWMRHNLTVLTPPSAASNATYPISLMVFYDRAMTDGVRPKDSLLKTDVGMSSNQLRIQMGALQDMFVGVGTGVANYSPGVTLTVAVKDYQEARNGAGQTPTPAFYLKRTQITLPTPATNPSQQQKLSTGNRLRAILFRPNVGSATQTYGTTSATPLTNIQLTRAGDQRANISFAALQQSNAAEFPVNFNATAAYTGFAVLDLAANGSLGGIRYSEFWPIPSTADTFLTLSVVGGTYNGIDMMVLEGVDLVQPK